MEISAVAGSKKERGNIWLWLELVVGARLTKERGIFGCGWSSIDEGNERENIWLWLELDQRRKGKGKYLGGAPLKNTKENIWQAKTASSLTLMNVAFKFQDLTWNKYHFRDNKS